MKGKKILIVDDDANIVRTIKLLLEMEGYEVITGSDGREGLYKVQSENPDLIVLDIMLPDIDGYELCRRIKSDNKYKYIRIIILTALTQKSDKELGKKSGANLYMMKPFDFNELNNRIKQLLDSKKEEGQILFL